MSFSKGAFRSMLAYLTEEEYQEFRQIRGCAAGFLNGHVKFLLLVPESQEISAALRKVPLERGSRFSLTANELFTSAVQIDGRSFPPGGWFPSNRLVGVQRLDIAEATK